jgi:hypothetical protein
MNKTAIIALALTALAPLAQAEPAAWSASVVQGDKQFQAPGEFHIKKAPFKLVFNAPSDFSFGVLASTGYAELSPLKTERQIADVIIPTNLAAEGPAATNTFLVVNNAGAIKAGENTAHVWTEDAGSDQHSFQTIQAGANHSMIATRQINEVIQYDSAWVTHEIPIANYSQAEICLLVTGLPPVGEMVHQSPKLIRLHQE